VAPSAIPSKSIGAPISQSIGTGSVTNHHKAFDLNICSSYDTVWEQDLIHSCGDSVDSMCVCFDAQKRIQSGEIGCSRDICPDDCEVCKLCLYYLTDCLFDDIITNQPTSFPSSSSSLHPSKQLSQEPTASSSYYPSKHMAETPTISSSFYPSKETTKAPIQVATTSLSIPADVECGDTSSSNDHVVSFRYHLEYNKSAMDTLNQSLDDVLKDIKRRIFELLAEMTYPECLMENKIIRMLRPQINRDMQSTYNITGISARPIDIVKVGEICNAIQYSCIVVDGQVTVFTDTYFNSTAEIDELSGHFIEILSENKLNLAGDYYVVNSIVTSNETPETESIYEPFEPTRPPTSNNVGKLDGDDDTTGGEETEQKTTISTVVSGLSAGMITMGSCFLLLLIFFLQRKYNHQKQLKDTRLESRHCISQSNHDHQLNNFPISMGSRVLQTFNNGTCNRIYNFVSVLDKDDDFGGWKPVSIDSLSIRRIEQYHNCDASTNTSRSTDVDEQVLNQNVKIPLVSGYF